MLDPNCTSSKELLRLDCKLELSYTSGVVRLNKHVSEASAKLQLCQRPAEVVSIVCFIQTAALKRTVQA